jgi:hypothetical protein
MTAHSTFAPAVAVSASAPAADPQKKHRRLMMMISLVGIALALALAFYGADYYSLGPAERPLSPKHHLLKPGGAIGVDLGLLGVLMFCAIFLYPLRKRWKWLRRLGQSKHWLDFHVILGIAAPVCIAFHSSFKFSGLAGIAFWVMVAVAVSGLVGRYLYVQIPRRVATGELSLKVFREVLQHQKMIPQPDLQSLMCLPAPEKVAEWPMFVALWHMVASDVARPLRIARLRLRDMEWGQKLSSCGGILPGRNLQLEWVIGLARQQAMTAKRNLFLSHAEEIFRLWHVIHRPFSYAFVTLALFHIVVAMMLGFI